MTSKRFSRLAFILSGAAIISYSAAAHAGFEWKGPLEAPAPQAAASAPADTGSMGDLAPVGAEPVAPMAPQAAAPAPAATPAAAPAAPATASAAGDVVAGFAKDVPLVMALQQIVPPGYQYSFASGVDAGTSVSWEGGKPWQSVLSDMLGAHGLGFTLQNNTVVVGPSQAMPAQKEAAAPAPAAAPAQDAMMTPMPSDSAAPAGSSAPLNIVSPPPGETASNAPAAAPVAPAPDASQTASAAPAPQKQETVNIRREKPKSLLERLGFVHHKSTTDTATASAAAAPAPAPVAPAPQPEKVAAADMPVTPAPAAAPVATDAPAATAQPAAAMTAVAPAGTWQGTKGATLRDVLKAWSDKAGVDLYWSIDYDYRLGEDVGFSGSYDEAVGSLLDKFASVRPQPYGQLHQGGNGPRVLVIKSYDLTP